MELKITKEKVLEAASKCSTAKATLETLFPECFVDDKYVDLMKWAKNSEGWEFGSSCYDCPTIGVDEDKVNGKRFQFILSSHFNWKIEGQYLIPTKK